MNLWEYILEYWGPTLPYVVVVVAGLLVLFGALAAFIAGIAKATIGHGWWWIPVGVLVAGVVFYFGLPGVAWLAEEVFHVPSYR